MGIEYGGSVRNEGVRCRYSYFFLLFLLCLFCPLFISSHLISSLLISSHLISSHLISSSSLLFYFNHRYLIPGRFVPSEYPLDDFFKFMVYLSDLGQWEKYA